MSNGASDESTPGSCATAHDPAAREQLFAVERGSDSYRCELRDYGPRIVTILFKNDKFLYSFVHVTRHAATVWAAMQREDIASTP